MSNEQTSNKHIAFILGMPRSGASAVAGAFSIAGAYLGEQSDIFPVTDAKQAWEHKTVSAINDKLLNVLGVTWDSFELLPKAWWKASVFDSLKKEIACFIDKMDPAVKPRDDSGALIPLSCFCAIKSPMMSRLFPIWKEVFEQKGFKVHVVIVHRELDHLAQSLRRQSVLEDMRLAMCWLTYHLDAERYTRGCQRAWVSYEALLAQPANVMSTCFQQAMDLTFPKGEWSAVKNRLAHFITKSRSYEPGDYVMLDNGFLKYQVEQFQAFLKNIAHTPESLVHVTCDAMQKDLQLLQRFFAECDAATQTEHAYDADLKHHVANLLSEVTLLKKEVQSLKLDKSNSWRVYVKNVGCYCHRLAKKHLPYRLKHLIRQACAHVNAPFSLSEHQKGQHVSTSLLTQPVSLSSKVMMVFGASPWEDYDVGRKTFLEKCVALGWRVFYLYPTVAFEGIDPSLEFTPYSDTGPGMTDGSGIPGITLCTLPEVTAIQAFCEEYHIHCPMLIVHASPGEEVLAAFQGGTVVSDILNDEAPLASTIATDAVFSTAEAHPEALIAKLYPKVSVIVLSYNNLEFTQACLHSLENYSYYPNMEVIVVDNASDQETRTYLKQYANLKGNIKLILNKENAGFAAGNNVGLREATGDFSVILNNDTYVTEGWIHGLLRHFRHDASLGLVGPVTNNIGNEAKIETSYKTMDDMTGEARAYTTTHRYQRLYTSNVAFFCVMMPKAVIDAIGVLCEEYGIGFFEDDDYCRRVLQQNYKIAIAEDVFVHHHFSASFNKIKTREREALFNRNKRIFEAKWGKWQPHESRL